MLMLSAPLALAALLERFWRGRRCTVHAAGAQPRGPRHRRLPQLCRLRYHSCCPVCSRGCAGALCAMPTTKTEHVLHLFIISTRTGDTTVFLLEREPGVVEFPQIDASDKDLDDEPELVRRIQAATGMDVAISGFLDPPAGTEIQPPNSKFLIGRVVSGQP